MKKSDDPITGKKVWELQDRLSHEEFKMAAGIRILYVDDEPDLLEIGKVFLEQSGFFSVATIGSAPAALELLDNEQFDAIISDYQMPGMDGIQFLAEVRERFGPVPFILFTGKGREEVVIQAINRGADFYLQKGGEPGAQFAELVHKIKAAASRKRADDALRKSEERYRNIVEDQTELISRFTPDGIHVFVNEAYCRYFGQKREDILGQRFRPKIPNEDKERVQQFFASLTTEHPVDIIEHYIIMPDGTVRWQRWSDRAIFDDSGNLIEYQSVGRDITEKKQAENERTEYQTRLKEVIEFLPEATLAIDRQKRIIVWNKAIEQMTGIPAAEMIGKGDYAYAVPFYGEARPQLMDLVFEDSEEIAARYPAIRREGDALIAEVFCNALYNNKGAWVFAKASPLYDSYGNIVGAIESIRDITDRKVAEQGLQKSEALLRDIIEKNPMSIQIVDREGFTLKVNPAFMRLFGSVPPPDFSIITDLVKSRPELENLISQVKSGEAVYLPDMCFNPHDIYPELPDVPTRVRAIIFPLNDRYGKPESFVFMHENITVQKLAEEGLRESEERYRTYIDNSPEGIFIVDETGRYLDVNPAACSMLGYTQKELLELSIKDMTLADLQSRAYLDFLGLLESGSLTAEYLLRKKNGDTVPVILNAVRLPDGRYMAYCTDITERKRAEETLFAMLNGITESALLMTPDGIVLAANETVALRLGLERAEELVGQNIFGLLPAEVKESRYKKVQEVLKSGQPVQFEDIRNGKVMHQALYPVKDPDGKVSRIAIFGNDITKRKRAEEELHQQFVFMQNLIDAIPCPLFLKDQQGIYRGCNTAFELFIGLKKDQIIGKSMYDIAPKDLADLYFERDQALFDKPGTQTYESKVRFADGSLHDVIFNKATFFNQTGDTISLVGIILDITGCKQAEESLAESEQKFQSLVEHALEGILILDLQGKVLFANNAAARTLEVDECAGLIGGNVMEFVAPESLEDVVKDFAEVSHGHDAYLAQYNVISAKGNKFTIESIGKVVIYEGKPADLISIRDITERKQAEVALCQSEEKFRTLFEKMTPGVFYRLSDGTLTDANPAALRMFGLTSGQFMGRNTYDPRWRVISETGELLSPDQHPSMIALRSGKPVRDLVVGVFNPQTDETTWLSTNAEPQFRNGEATPYQVFVTMYDITGRRRSEEALRESEERFRLLLQHVPSLSVQGYNMDGTTHYWNDASESLYGYTAQEAVGKNLVDLIIPPEMKDDVRKAILYMAESGQPIPASELSLMRKDGSRVPVFSSHAIVKRPGGGTELFCIDIDLTELKRAEAALNESEEKYRNLFMTGADGIVIHDTQGRNVDANIQACEMLGYSHSELLAMRVSDLIPPEERKQKPPRLTEVMAGKTVCYERKLQRKDGTLLDIEIRASRVMEGTVQAFWRDITERKRAEELLNESARYTRNLIEVSLDPLVTISPEGKITDVNAATERVTGYTRNHLIGTDFSDYFTDPVNAKKGYTMVFDHGVVRDYPLEIRHRDGKVTPVMYNATIYPDESGNAKGIFAAARDITERKMAEEALHQANKKLKLLSSITRHDINNQLTVLIGYLTILKRKQPDPVLNEYFVKVSTAAQRISSMIQFTKEYESIGVKAPAWQNCCTVADTAAKDAQPGQIRIKNDILHSAEVFADPLVVKVFYNLIDNAVRYGGKITTIRFFVEETGDDHLIVCKDDGDGVVAEEKEKIFERGFGRNTGLGLALAREILDITGITIKECGEPGKGARFEMTVPKGAWRIGRTDENKE